MARRGAKRIDLSSQSMITFNLPAELHEAQEYYAQQIRKPPFSLPAEIRADLEKLLHVKFSDAGWQKIEFSTGKYLNHAHGYREGLSAVAVRNACEDIVGVLDVLITTVNKYARDPLMNRFLSYHAFDLDLRETATLVKSI